MSIRSQKIARGLGLFSLGLGVAELVAPRQLQRLLGVSGRQSRGLLQVLGVREFMHGVDLLSHRHVAPGVLSRVAGDLLDGALLSLAGKKTRNPKGLLAAAAMVLPVVALDIWCAKREAKKMNLPDVKRWQQGQRDVATREGRSASPTTRAQERQAEPISSKKR
jgi:hypothetical protein